MNLQDAYIATDPQGDEKEKDEEEIWHESVDELSANDENSESSSLNSYIGQSSSRKDGGAHSPLFRHPQLSALLSKDVDSSKESSNGFSLSKSESPLVVSELKPMDPRQKAISSPLLEAGSPVKEDRRKSSSSFVSSPLRSEMELEARQSSTDGNKNVTNTMMHDKTKSLKGPEPVFISDLTGYRLVIARQLAAISLHSFFPNAMSLGELMALAAPPPPLSNTQKKRSLNAIWMKFVSALRPPKKQETPVKGIIWCFF